MSRIDAVLDDARARLHRLSAGEVPDALRRGAVLVDIRPATQRAAEGGVAAALVIERNVLEWRCDPTSDARLPGDEQCRPFGGARRPPRSTPLRSPSRAPATYFFFSDER